MRAPGWSRADGRQSGEVDLRSVEPTRGRDRRRLEQPDSSISALFVRIRVCRGRYRSRLAEFALMIKNVRRTIFFAAVFLSLSCATVPSTSRLSRGDADFTTSDGVRLR